MRIVVDLQGAQAENRYRGIGRYALSFTKALVRNRGSHELLIVLNADFPDAVDDLRKQFSAHLPADAIRVWEVSPEQSWLAAGGSSWKGSVAELAREAFISSLNPDLVLVSSLFEGLVDSSVVSIGRLHQRYRTAVVLYDLIPGLMPELYLQNPLVARWYERRLDDLRRSDLVLSISDATRRDMEAFVGAPPLGVYNISAAVDARFQPRQCAPGEAEAVLQPFAVEPGYLMYTGGADPRKNLDRLIESFALVPKAIRRAHPLLVVCKMDPAEQARLQKVGASCGLRKDELVFTGYVSDDDLVVLYNLCRAFVFPALYEGFGLPALEAIACGKPVIGSNVSSIPEVIGNPDALFDPTDVQAMSEAMLRVLRDDEFCRELVVRGQEHAESFSWDETARRAIAAINETMGTTHAQGEERGVVAESLREQRPKLAYFSPLPPAKSGISYYSAELLPELARFYDIDVVVPESSTELSDAWVAAVPQVRTVDWVLRNQHHYDRVVYHFGNSGFHDYMFAALEQLPGVVVLHDFFLSGVVAHLDVTGQLPGYWAQSLYSGHGYPATAMRYNVADTADAVLAFPCNRHVIEASRGVIVHSAYSQKLAVEWYGEAAAEEFAVVPQLCRPKLGLDREAARRALGMDLDARIVCSFGLMGATKLNDRLISAWSESELANDPKAVLVFVGAGDPGPYGEAIAAQIKRARGRSTITVTGWVDEDEYQNYMAAADAAVQLRGHSRGESSRTVLECMACGLPTVVNANGSNADLPADALLLLPDEFTTEELVDGLHALATDTDQIRQLAATARGVVADVHSPDVAAKNYVAAIENHYRRSAGDLPALISALGGLDVGVVLPADVERISDQLVASIPEKLSTPQLFVDVSELVKVDSGSGIQRVVRSLLNQWLVEPPSGYRVEPIYATEESAYRYARSFTLKLLGCPETLLDDDVVEFHSGDVFLGMDLQPQVVPAQRSFYERLRRWGVTVKFLVYDLIPVLNPAAFPPGAEQTFLAWLDVVAEADGAICISESVAQELRDWMAIHRPERDGFEIDWFHLGADVENSIPSRGLPDDAAQVLKRVKGATSFFSVGTIEPRKRHRQVLDAFECLWAKGSDAVWVVLGKQGWMVEDVVDRLRSHPELGRRLFWLDGVSDEYLERLYEATDCLIAASDQEGFGLPLIEAARNNLPVLARDIPVFREVGGSSVSYFSGESGELLAESIERWLATRQNGALPSVGDMVWLTWEASAASLAGLIDGSQELATSEAASAH